MHARELQHLTGPFQQLKTAQSGFRACLESVSDIKPTNKDRTILVPLTNSLYVPGRLSDIENVIVDVGTGYYVKKSRADTTKHYHAKVDYVHENLEKLQETIAKKQDNLQYVVNTMHVKEKQGAAAAVGKDISS